MPFVHIAVFTYKDIDFMIEKTFVRSCCLLFGYDAPKIVGVRRDIGQSDLCKNFT